MSMTTAWTLLLAGGFAIQPPGQFHAGEPVARDGESWLALELDGRRASLVATTVQVRAVRDELVDAEGERTGLVVSSGRRQAIAYVRGGRLSPGPIESATLDPGPDHAGLPYALTFGGHRYLLASRCESRPVAVREQQAQFQCRIELSSGGQVQVLGRLIGYREDPGASMSLGDDASPALLFAGDLDRDGKLDLLLDTTDHYNLVRPTLFLSAPAAPGELLQEVASHPSVGC